MGRNEDGITKEQAGYVKWAANELHNSCKRSCEAHLIHGFKNTIQRVN